MATTEAGAHIRLGSRVTVKFDDGETLELTIHGRGQNLAAGVISATAPLARNLLGAKAGDCFSYTVCGATQSVTVLRVDAPGL